MRLSDEVNKCVVFLGRESGDDIALEGTGFFVRDHSGKNHTTYLVTAGHVARVLAGKIGIRFNSKGGPYRVLPREWPEWIYHPDENVDLAAVPFEPPDWADTTAFPVSSFVSGFKRQSKNIGPGDIAYVVGLFRILKATRRNIPLVHTGHIAAMASDEPIPVIDPVSKLERQAHVYLVESRAISGASGSPVFVRRSIEHRIPDPSAPHNSLIASTPGSVWFLGVWSGSWPREADQSLIEGASLSRDAKVSVGVGLVVPAPFLHELLSSEEMQRARAASTAPY